MFTKVAGETVFAHAALVGTASQLAPKFDAVSIKPGNQNTRNPQFVAMSHRTQPPSPPWEEFEVEGRETGPHVEDQPVVGLILFAFDLDGTRLMSAPAWVKTELTI
jgi:hypothetical protein